MEKQNKNDLAEFLVPLSCAPRFLFFREDITNILVRTEPDLDSLKSTLKLILNEYGTASGSKWYQVWF